MQSKNLIDATLVQRLVATQFPQWKDLPIRAIIPSGWDNRTFRLGEQMLVRLPSAAEYAVQVEKEQRWLPKLAPFLPLHIPVSIVIGEPADGYPWKWSIYRWLKGEPVTTAQITDLCDFAGTLGEFLIALQRIDATDGPLPGPHSFYRGGSLMVYDDETRHAIKLLKNKINSGAAIKVWEIALASAWQKSPIWVHGDLSAGNLLVKDGKLCAVIDFGQLTVGDPACDLAIAWTLFKNESREIFRMKLALDSDTWARGRGWTLWKALIIAAGLAGTNSSEGKQCWRIIDEVIGDYKVNIQDKYPPE